MSYKLKGETSGLYTTIIVGESQQIFQLTRSWNSQFLGIILKRLKVSVSVRSLVVFGDTVICLVAVEAVEAVEAVTSWVR